MLAQIAPVALAASVLAACYDLPQPACGFTCGPSGECPSSYTCNAADNTCHLNGSSPSLVCGPLDAGMVDAPADAEVDVTPPTIVARMPADGAGSVDTSTIVMATFSEPVIGASSTTFQVLVDDMPLGGSLGYDGATRTVRFDPAAGELPQGVYVTVRVGPGISDLAGNPLVPVEWSFTTQHELEGPVVLAREPAPDATGIGVDAILSASFDEPLGSLPSGSFTLAQGGAAIPGSLAYDAATMTARFHPDLQLVANTTYTATLTAAILDGYGNPLQDAPVTWSFTTGADTLAPHLLDVHPNDGQADLPVTTSITIWFDEPVTGVDATSFQVNGGAITGTVLSQLNGTRWRFLPSSPLPASSTFTVTLSSAITDTATPPNPLAPYSFTFTTGS